VRVISLIIAAVVSLAALVAWGLWIRNPGDAPASQTLGLALAVPVAAWLTAMLAPDPINIYQKGAVVLGLILAVLGLALRLSKFLPEYVTHAHLLFTYTLYATAFAAVTSGLPTPWAVIVVLAAAGVMAWLWPKLSELRESVIVYALILFLGLWQSFELVNQQPDAPAAWAGLAGMVLVCAATAIEARERFRPASRSFATAVLPVLVLGHLAVAWSVWL
jgi:uncharacterized membrane protein YhhN